MKTGSESIDVIIRRRRILFAGFVARVEDTILPKWIIFGELVGGAGCVWGQGEKWIGCFLDDLRAFGINTDQWTTSRENGARRRNKMRNVHGEMDRCRKSAGLRHTLCSNLTGSTKERIA